MHVENELAEIVTTDDREFEEIIEEYEEEILVQDRRRSRSHHRLTRLTPRLLKVSPGA